MKMVNGSSKEMRNLNSPHSISELGVELKSIMRGDSLCVWLLIKDLILCA